MANQNSIADLDTTPANNLNFRGQSMQGTAPVNTIDNMFQKQSAMLAALYDSIGGAATAGGTATALTVTITDDWTAYAHGLYLAIKAPSAATGAATLVPTVPTAGALASKKIRRQGDSAIQANDWLAGSTILLKYDSAYDTAAGAWVLLNTWVDTSSFALSSSVPAAAAQSDQETSTSTTTYVSPGRQQFHPSAAKAWVNFTGTGTVTINASYNVSSITDNGVGDYTVNFSTAFSSANYAGLALGSNDGVGDAAIVRRPNTAATTSAFRLLFTNTGGAATDAGRAYAAFFGDQ